MTFKQFIKKVLRKIRRPLTVVKTVPVVKTVYETRRLEGKNVLITGGGSGIGLSIAEKCIQNGAKVIITGRNEEKLKASAEKSGAYYMVMDVRNVSTFPDKIQEACKIFGQGQHIDILVNNAGVAGGSFSTITEEKYDQIMDTNVKGTYFLSKAVSEHMIANKIHGHILNVSSAGALKPDADPYYFSKWAVNGMTKGLADVLLDKNIVVNAIGPGPTVTPIMGTTPDSSNLTTGKRFRYAMPSEIADLAVFMISESGDMIIGDTFYISGGSGTVSYHFE